MQDFFGFPCQVWDYNPHPSRSFFSISSMVCSKLSKNVAVTCPLVHLRMSILLSVLQHFPFSDLAVTKARISYLSFLAFSSHRHCYSSCHLSVSARSSAAFLVTSALSSSDFRIISALSSSAFRVTSALSSAFLCITASMFWRVACISLIFIIGLVFTFVLLVEICMAMLLGQLGVCNPHPVLTLVDFFSKILHCLTCAVVSFVFPMFV